MGDEWSLMVIWLARGSSFKAEREVVFMDFICLKPLSHSEDEPRKQKDKYFHYYNMYVLLPYWLQSKICYMREN